MNELVREDRDRARGRIRIGEAALDRTDVGRLVMLETLRLDEIAECDEPSILAVMARAEQRVRLSDEVAQDCDARLVDRQRGR